MKSKKRLFLFCLEICQEGFTILETHIADKNAICAIGAAK